MGNSIQSPVNVLVHIGYHKTGPSWLQHLIFEDPASGYGSVGQQSPTHPARRLVAEHPLHHDPPRIRRAFERLIRKVEAPVREGRRDGIAASATTSRQRLVRATSPVTERLCG
jgi:hypothetical protein